jgi:hypothetical protein
MAAADDKARDTADLNDVLELSSTALASAPFIVRTSRT